MLLLYSIPTIFSFPLLTPLDVVFSEDEMCKLSLFCKWLFMRGTVVPRLRDTRDLSRGRIPSGACGIQKCADFSCPVQACDRPLCRRHIAQFLVELCPNGPTRVEELVSPIKTQLACQIEVLVEFPTDRKVLGGRGARIFLVFISYVFLGTPLVTVVRNRAWPSPR